MAAARVLLLPAPSLDPEEWGAVVFCDVAGPVPGNKEPAGQAFHNLAYTVIHGLEDAEEQAKHEAEEDETFRKKHKSDNWLPIEGEHHDLNNQDHYAVMGLEHLRHEATEDQIRKTYRELSLKYHPDKMQGKEGVEGSDLIFKAIQKAYDVLGDPVKRRSYDSSFEFDDAIPTGFEKGSFYEVFGRVFKRNAVWSAVKPVPMLGDDDTPDADVDAFYHFWDNFKSWRDFSYLDEHVPESAECREERRWMEKENERERNKRKKAEFARVRKLVDLAYSKDPRVVRRRKAELEAKEKAKQDKAESRRREQEAKEKAEEEERQRKAREEEEERQRKQREKTEKEWQKKQLKKERARLRTLLQALLPAAEAPGEADVETYANEAGYERIKALNDSIEGTDAARARAGWEAEWGPVRDAIRGREEAAARAAEEEAAKKKAAKTKKKAGKEGPEAAAGGDGPSGAAAERPWTEQELFALQKALVKFPPGAANRWESVAVAMGHTREPQEIIAMASKIRTAKMGKPPPDVKVEDDYSKFAHSKGVRQEIKSAPRSAGRRAPAPPAPPRPRPAPRAPRQVDEKTTPPVAVAAESPAPPPAAAPAPPPAAAATASPPPRAEAGEADAERKAKKAAAVPPGAEDGAGPANKDWTVEQQQALERGLKAHPATLGAERWKLISKLVPGKTPKQCMERFKELVAFFKTKRDKEAKGEA
eukprot:tig00001542_g9317.t1